LFFAVLLTSKSASPPFLFQFVLFGVTRMPFAFREFALSATTPKVQWCRTTTRERVRKAEAGGRFITAAFVIVLAVGTVLYVATVVHVFSPAYLAQLLRN
jgi:hypothetical protein